MLRRWLAALNLWLLVGACMLCGAVGAIQDLLQPMRAGVQTEGEVVAVSFGSRYNPRTVSLRFRTRAGAVVVAQAETSPFHRYAEGQRLVMFYHPDDPDQVFLPEYLWFGVCMSVVTGLLVGVLPVRVGLRKWRHRLRSVGA